MENQTHTIEPFRTRSGADFEPIHFQYNNVGKRMTSIDSELYRALNPTVEEKKEKREIQKENNLRNLAEKITMEGKKEITYKEAVEEIERWSAIIEGKGIKDRAAKERIKAMVTHKMLEKDNEKGTYRLI